MIYEVSNLSFSYNKQMHLLQDVNLALKKGEIVSIIGANGAGKTTFIKCLLGINKPDEGVIKFDGEDISHLGRDLYKKVGFVPQAKHYSTNFLVEDMILLGRSSRINLASQPSEADVKAVEDVIVFLGIEKLKGKSVDKISGGELQMVLLARALVNQPQVLILDEPESNLDWYNQLTVVEAIEKLAQSGIACIFNTHYPEHALRISDKTLLLKNGQTIAFGKSCDVITTDNLRTLYSVETVIDEVHMGDRAYATIACVSKSN